MKRIELTNALRLCGYEDLLDRWRDEAISQLKKDGAARQSLAQKQALLDAQTRSL